jgi:hypothetical protein
VPVWGLLLLGRRPTGKPRLLSANGGSDLGLLCDLKGIIDLDPKITSGTL